MMILYILVFVISSKFIILCQEQILYKYNTTILIYTIYLSLGPRGLGSNTTVIGIVTGHKYVTINSPANAP